MKYKIHIARHIQLPKSHSFKSAFVKGVIAAYQGKAEGENPYANSGGGFGAGYFFQWSRGYSAFKHGLVEIVESQSL